MNSPIERFFALPQHVVNHPVISHYIHDQKRFKMVISGRQSFKSEIAKRHLFKEAISHARARYLVGAPTYAQVKNLYWTGNLGIVDMFPKPIIKSISDTDMIIRLINGTSIELFSADTVQRKEGSYANGVIIDEAGDCDIKTVLYQSIMPQLTNTKGWVYIVGVPRQTMGLDYKELWKKYSTGEYPEWGCYTWRASDVLDKTELERIRGEVDSATYEQEYEGKFVDLGGGLAYHRWNKDLHIKNVPMESDLPICVAWDFNASIMQPQFFQWKRDQFMNVIDQVVQKNTNVFSIAPIVKQKLAELCGSEERAKQRKVLFYGDFAGTQVSANARGSAWDELRQLFVGYNVDQQIKSNPLIDRRVAAVNARLQTADGNVHMSVNEKCKELQKDYDVISLADLTKNKERLGERGHASDAIGYACHYLAPIRTLS